MHLQKSKKSDDIPSLPKELVFSFLEERIGIDNLKNAKKINSTYLWSRSDVERYRINVYVEIKRNKEDYYHSNIIGYSFFVHYDKVSNLILDKTKR